MKFQALKRYWFSAECWDLTVNANTGGIISESLRETAHLSLVPGVGSQLEMNTLVPLGVGTVLRNIKDREGNLIFPSHAVNSGLAYTVTAETPLVNMYGTVEGYSSSARRLVTA